jgi:hypothetical protein
VETLNISTPDDENGRQVDADQPQWVKAAYRLGIPGLIALGLVWFLAAKQGDALAKQVEVSMRIEYKMDQHADAMRQSERIDHAHSERIESYLRIICLINASRSAAAGQACMNVSDIKEPGR